MERQKMTKQYFPTETVFRPIRHVYRLMTRKYLPRLPFKYTILWIYIFILNSIIPNNINPVTECSIIYIIFCLKVWTSLEFRHIDLFNCTVIIKIQKYDKLL